MDNKELLLEIGTEEIPAAALDKAVSDLKALAVKFFADARIECDGVEAYGTPRRLVLYVKSMAAAQKDSVIEKRGPAKSAAYDADGNPTKAAIGFARGQGVDVSDLEIISTDKGEYINVSKKIVGKATDSALCELLPKLIFSIPFRKSMRWSDGTIRFVRPIHSILALFGGNVIKFEIGDSSEGSIHSSNLSFGHRFLSPSKFKVKDFKQYKDELKKRSVVCDAERRKEMIKADIAKIEEMTGCKVVADDELLAHVANLVEFPVTVTGKFEDKFLKLPKEALINSMKVHQKYFAMTQRGESLANSFVNVLNTKPKDESVVVKGNERVLRARLSDAEFFYNEDLKAPLESYNERLKGVIFQNKLGTVYEKVERIMKNAEYIAESATFEHESDVVNKAVRTAELCKADLVTQMVVEFPKLQGIMGREYALLSGENQDVAQAIYEHYLPTGADDDNLPCSDIGAIVSIADKIDTIVGCFSVGLIPTGSADPFALRRQTLGIMRILYAKRDKFKPLSLKSIIEKAYENLGSKAARGKEEIINDVLNFFEVRFKVDAIDKKAVTYDVVDAVLALGLDNVDDSLKKIDALSEFKKRPDFEALSISFKRVGNIVKSVDGVLGVDKSLLSADSEKTLYDNYVKIKDVVIGHCSKGDYIAALKATTQLKEPIDKFFDDVMVMVEDEAIKNNRLGLLQSIQRVFLNIADFSKIN